MLNHPRAGSYLKKENLSYDKIKYYWRKKIIQN